MQEPARPSWPPPPASPPPPPLVRPAGWYQSADGAWHQATVAPAPGWWLASDLRWYPPDAAVSVGQGAGWRTSRWGLGDCWWGALAYVVASLAMSLVLVAALLALDTDATVDGLEFGPYSLAIGLLANVLAFAGVPWLATRRKGLRSLADDFGLRFRLIDLPIGIGFGIGALIVATVVSALLDGWLGSDGDASNVPVDDLHGPGQIVVFAIAIAAITPVIEELFFRGLVNRSLLKRGARPVTSLIITTLVFVLPHLLAQPSWPNIAVLAGAIVVFGVAFHLACLVTGNRLGAPIVAHAVVNGTAVVALALG